MSKSIKTRQIQLERRSPAYWQVTFDPPQYCFRLFRAVIKHARWLCKTLIGSRWIAPELFDGWFCFGGEERADANLSYDIQ